MNRQQRRAQGRTGSHATAGPDAARALLAEAVRHHRSGRLSDADALYRQILRIDPGHADSLHLLGVLALQAGRFERAIELIGRAIAREGRNPEFHYNLGNAVAGAGRPDEAVACFRQAILLRPDHAAAHGNLGGILTMRGLVDDGIACFRKVVALTPDDSGGHYNLGQALARQWRLDDAVAALRRSIALRPDADAWNTLGNLLRDVGRAGESLAAYDAALRIDPTDLALRSNRILVESYLPAGPSDDAGGLARRFGALASARALRPFRNWTLRPEAGPIRIGLVSGDLHNHPVGYFLESLLSKADPGKVVFLAFPAQPHEDELTARIRPLCAAWTPIAGMADEAAARLIHDQGVQLLLDLSGHTAGNRLPLFAWRPAPVQATWLGYFATTGVAEIDYIVADETILPEAASASFTETPCRLPEIYYCFTPPAAPIEVAPLPARAGGALTFGCFNNLAKISDRVVAVWARVLGGVPASRLMLKAAPLRDHGIRIWMRQRFARHGIAADRLLLEPASSREDYLRAYDGIDIALDPFPFPGGATTFEALWMGVPVLTKAGDTLLSRVGETIMRQAGLPDWLAVDEDDYVRRACRLASDIDLLARLRGGLRAQVLASPLFDAERFARRFEAAAAGMVGRGVAGGG